MLPPSVLPTLFFYFFFVCSAPPFLTWRASGSISQSSPLVTNTPGRTGGGITGVLAVSFSRCPEAAPWRGSRPSAAAAAGSRRRQYRGRCRGSGGPPSRDQSPPVGPGSERTRRLRPVCRSALSVPGAPGRALTDRAGAGGASVWRRRRPAASVQQTAVCRTVRLCSSRGGEGRTDRLAAGTLQAAVRAATGRS